MSAKKKSRFWLGVIALCLVLSCIYAVVDRTKFGLEQAGDSLEAKIDELLRLLKQ